MHYYKVTLNIQIYKLLLNININTNVTFSGHEPHPLFSEMVELKLDEWKETARWIRFEEDVEEGANRWSKPHVSSLSLHSLMGLRDYLKKGTILLDLQADTLEEIIDMLLETMMLL